MDAQHTILITSIVVIYPTLTNRNLSKELSPDTSDYRLVVDTSHSNAISIQSQATKYSLYSYDVSKIIYDPELQSFYWHNVRSFIEATLLGYHGMIVFLLSSHIKADNLNVTPFEILFTAVDQIFYCIQSSKCKYTQYFQVLFSHYALSNENGNIFDLCLGLDAAAHLYRDVKGQQHTLIKTRLSDLDNLKQLIDRNHAQFKSELSQGIEGTHNLAQLGYHEFICINVGFTGFSASFAPIGGELTFVVISTDYIAAQTQNGNETDVNDVSWFTTKTIDSLYSLLNNIIAKKDSDIELETPLCGLLRDGVGGPCKTCVISLLPDKFGLNATENEATNEHTQLLNIAHQFSLVRNCPNRRIFAEKALMNVYIQEMSSNVSEVTKSGEDSTQEFGEDTIKQAAIALEQAVLEYNKRIQLTESNNEFEIEAFNIADFTRKQSTTNSKLPPIDEHLRSDMLSQIPMKTVIGNITNPELLKTGNLSVFNATRSTVINNNNLNLNEQNKDSRQYSDSSKYNNGTEIESSVQTHVPVGKSYDSNALEELIVEEMTFQERSMDVTILEQQSANDNKNKNNNNNNNNNNSNNTESTPLSTNIRITLNMNNNNQNAQEINIQLLNPSKAEVKSDNISNEHNIKPITNPIVQNKPNKREYNAIDSPNNPDAINESFNRTQSYNESSDSVRDSYSIGPQPSNVIRRDSLQTSDETVLPFSQDMQTGVTPSLDINAPLFEQIQEKKGDAQIAEVVTFMLQDPMRGAPRCYQARGSKEVLQRRDLGSVFTGHAITTWIMNNVNGIQVWGDAETFGQWLLDQGELIHSEGSFVFAGAESLFYYARRSQPSTRNLSFEEIKRLMSEAKKVLQLANTEFYEPGKSFNMSDSIVSKVAGTTINDDMILHQLMAEQLVVMKAGSRNVSIEGDSFAASALNQSQLATVSSTHQYETSPNNALHGSEGNGKRFLLNNSDNSIENFGANVNNISNMFETREVVVQNAASSEDTEVIKVVERMEKVLIGNLTEKYVENIVQVFELHPLFDNCRNGCRMGVLRNLVLTFGVNFEDEQKRTAIFYSAAGDQCRIGLELIHSHANINHIDKFELSPLLVATQLGYVSFLRMLLSHGADVTHFDKAGSNAYHLACKLEAIGCLQKLLNNSKPGVLDKLDNDGFSPIHYAIQNKFARHLELLFKHKIDPTVLDPKGLSYLSFAIYNHSICYITPMLKSCSVLFGQANSDLSTALHVAAIQSTSECLQVLLSVKSFKKHLDIHQCDSKGRTALHAACKLGIDDSVRILLNNNASVVTNDTNGHNPLLYAKANPNITQGVIDLLIACEINDIKGIVKLQEGGSKTCQIQ